MLFACIATGLTLQQVLTAMAVDSLATIDELLDKTGNLYGYCRNLVCFYPMNNSSLVLHSKEKSKEKSKQFYKI